MSQIEFEIDGAQYRADKLDAFKQLHITRKLAPVLPKLVPLFSAYQSGAAGDNLLGLADAAGPFADALAAMPEADVDYIVKTCLAVTRKQHMGAWAPLVVNGNLMFDEVGLDVLLPVVARVIQGNLGNFTRGLFANSQASLPAAPPP